MPYPILAAHRIASREQLLLDYWLGDLPHRVHTDTLRAGHANRGLHVFHTNSKDELSDLVATYHPVLTITSPEIDDEKTTSEQLLDLGLAARWILPPPGHTIQFPSIDLPDRKRPVFVIEDNDSVRGLYRQILYFAGFDTRTDFRTPAELVAALYAAMEANQADRGRYLPELVIINLDAKRMNAAHVLAELKAFYRKHAGDAAPQLMLTKDFDRPGLEFGALETFVRERVRRVFHPIEALYVLLEAYHLRGSARIPPPPGSLPIFRSLRDLLHSPGQLRLLMELPSPGQNIRPASILPFTWLYETTELKRGHGAVLRSDQA